MMNPQPSKFFPVRRWLPAAVLVLGLFTATGAQAAIEQRWLFIFNTSSGMKKRLPAVETQIHELLTKDFARGFREGDSIGVWTFDDKLHMGKFPLTTWDPKRTVMLESNLVTFVHKQSYSGTTSFAVLQPTLDSVIEDSDRLTVVIVCDGDGEIQWTPYNEGMNETLKQTRDDRKKIKQPYVIVLRTQLGKYVGATVNFPPRPANLPPFPLLPSEIKAVAPPPPVVVAKPPPPAAPLVIVGTHVSSDTNDVAKYSAANQVAASVEKSNPPPVAVVVVTQTVVHVAMVTNPAAAVPAVLAATSPLTASATNAAAALTGTDDPDTRILTYVGVGLLGAAVVLVIFLITRGRSRPHGSLITTSMQGNPRPPEQK
ncbi:MAG: hypothetical protein P4N60_17725 [Verrucomicrobiae bacterium]|nr:hypothetical protein [Verrucomicrobiae bacterium]